MRMLLMQSELRGYGGHPHQETLGWIDACRSRDVGLEIFCNVQATPAVVEELPAKPIFGIQWSDVERFCRRDQFPDEGDAYGQPLTAFLMRSHSVARNCAEAWLEADRRADVVVFPWAFAGLMNGAAEWLADLAPEERPAVVFNIVAPENDWAVDRRTGGATGDFSFFRVACRRLAALAPPGKLLLTAVDERMGALVERIGGVECRLAPLLQYYGDYGRVKARRSVNAGGDRIIGLLGHVRWEKGSDLTVEIIDAVCSADPGVRFVVQAADNAMALDWVEQLRRRGPHLRADLSAGNPPREDYLERLAACDMVVLPYNAGAYAMRASGIFADATAMGLPVVVPAETWSADRLADGWGAGETFAVTEPAAIQAATQRVLARLPQLKAKANDRKSAWRAAQSVEAYMDQMLAWTGGHQAAG